jgi:hypothetical protein
MTTMGKLPIATQMVVYLVSKDFLLAVFFFWSQKSIMCYFILPVTSDLRTLPNRKFHRLKSGEIKIV